MVTKCPHWIQCVALVGMSSLAGCSSLAAVFDRQEESSLNQVDSLLGMVEQVHMECELSRRQSLSALDALHEVVAPKFQGDAIGAHQALLLTLENSMAQAEGLRDTLEPMAEAAGDVVEKWNTDLDAFASERMRAHSQTRLEKTNALYVQVHLTLASASELYDMFNLGLNDHALYLGNDLNATSVAVIEEELLLVTQVAEELDNRLASCMDACQIYVRENALRGQLAQQVAVAPDPVAGLRPGLSTDN